jgi:hypothetical protein
LGLIGLVGGLAKGIPVFLSAEGKATVWGGSLGMAALCGVFLILCVQSFIAARKARKEEPSRARSAAE